MNAHSIGRARRLACIASIATLTLFSGTTRAEDKIVFLTSWYAQAEHGGFYEAEAKGIYKKYGLDVTIRMGGPQVNGIQLLTAGAADLIIGYDFQVLSGIEQGLPITTVGASMQVDLQGMMTHDDVPNLAALKGKTILVASSGRTSWWPWLKAKYGYTEEQTRPYTFNLQPFFVDPNTVQQSYPSSEPYQALQHDTKVHFFLFANDGYPPYGTTIVTTRKLVATRPDVVARFVRASMEGWKEYLIDPAPANQLIKRDNPNMTDDQIAFGIAKMKELKVVTGGDAATMGIGVMTDERWKKTDEYMVSAGLLKAGTDWHQAYTTEFVKNLKVMP